MVNVVSRWLSYAAWMLVGDGAYASVVLAHACVTGNVTRVSRLRLDARRYDFPEPQPKGKRGRKPNKGKRLPKLGELASDPNQPWQEAEIAWYGEERKRRKLLSGICLWHTNGQDPVKICWVLSVDPEGNDKPEAFFSTDVALVPERMVEIFVPRWDVEVTFEEVRRHLGVETQRQWSDRAIARTTPVLMGADGAVFAGVPDSPASAREGHPAGAPGGLVCQAGSNVLGCVGLGPASDLGGKIFRQLNTWQRPAGVVP